MLPVNLAHHLFNNTMEKQFTSEKSASLVFRSSTQFLLREVPMQEEAYMKLSPAVMHLGIR